VRIGAHVPTRGSLVSAVDAAKRCGAEAIQVFVSNPRAWAAYSPRWVQAEEFRDRVREAGIGPVFVHTAYLVNVASPTPEFRRKSEEAARSDLEVAEAIGAAGLVIHAGAGASTERGQALARAATSLLAIAQAARSTKVTIELTAGGAGSVAATLPEARQLFDALGDDRRFALCLDTCHLFAAGYPLDRPGGAASCFAELKRLRLSSRLVLLHANDAAFPRGSRRDRHTHIGQGHIGERGFAAILREPAVGRAAVVVETPGRLEDHARNVATVRRLTGPAGQRSRAG
jgi:deoxyribonuclease IV